MTANKTESRFVQELNKRVLILDGAMGTMIEKLGIYEQADTSACADGHCPSVPDFLVISNPDGIRRVHELYLEAGCDIVETNTFGGNRIKLAEYELVEHLEEINVSAARLARQACDSFEKLDGKPRFVAGSMGPTGLLPSSSDPQLGNISPSELEDIYCEQSAALIKGGVDYLLIETGQDILEIRSALFGAKKAAEASDKYIPVFCQATFDENGHMLLGTSMEAVITTLWSCGADGVGMNCSTGPDEMRPQAETLSELAGIYTSIVPNAGMPINLDGVATYPLGPEIFAEKLVDFAKRYKVNIVGGCCGTSPEHLRELAKKLGTHPAPQKPAAARHLLSSSLNAVSMHQEPRPLLVGERMNTQGSRDFKKLVLEKRYQDAEDLALRQLRGGARLLDLCVVLSEDADETGQMEAIIKRLRGIIDAPLLIDTTDPQVMAHALLHFPGRCVLNSISLENRQDRLDPILALARKYGSAVVALTVDDEGMAISAERKLEIAENILRIALEEYGLPRESFIFDLLTFTLASGEEKYRNSAAETIKGIKLLNEKHPGILTSLGVSNVSFGLTPPARKVLNSVFLHHTVTAGLSWAMVNPAALIPFAEIDAKERELADNLIFNRSNDALPEFIEYFEGRQSQNTKGKPDADESGLSVSQKIYKRILEHRRDGLQTLLEEEIKTRKPVKIINELLLPAMKEVGDKFGTGELILPFVLQSAEVMKQALDHLKPHMQTEDLATRGKIVLATVYGDVHDIGKNLAATIFSNNGYDVFDLGKQVKVKTIVEKAIEHKADAIGLSALLVSTSKQMQLCVEELERQGLNIPVIIGGAAINRQFGARINVTESKSLYPGGVFYAKDVFEGLQIMDRLSDTTSKGELFKSVQGEALRLLEKKESTKPQRTSPAPRPDKLDSIPKPPNFGTALIEDIPLEEVFELLNEQALFRLHWGLKGISSDEYRQRVEQEFKPLLESLKQEVIEQQSLTARAVYGYFPCCKNGDKLSVYNPDKDDELLFELDFPRQKELDELCIADYFATAPQKDTCAFQLVSVQGSASKQPAQDMEEGQYRRAMHLRGLVAQCTEATAEWVSARIRQELQIPAERGKRFSPGYGSWPDLADQQKLFKALAPERIGVKLSEAFLMIPEESSSAIFVHHPQAKYFSTKER